MAANSKHILGSSTTSLHQSFTTDVIPKEYHRKVLKKIAQLTRVIHSLHTRVDESEEELQFLKSQHDKETTKLQEENESKLKEWEEEKALVIILQTQLSVLETEKKDLSTKQEATLKETELKFESIKNEHSRQISEMNAILLKAKDQLNKKESEYTEMEKLTGKLKNELKDHREASCKEIEQLKQQYSNAIKEREELLTQLKGNHLQIVQELHERKEQEISALRNALSEKQDGLLQNEMELHQKSLNKLRQDFIEKENSLKQELCTLSSELSQTKDHLALSEQKVRDLEREMTTKEKTSEVKRDTLLKQKEEDLEKLRERNRIILEKFQIQKEDIQHMTERIGELEAVCVSHEHDTKSLQKQLEVYMEKLKYLEEEKEQVLMNAKCSTDESQQIVTSLEKEIQRLNKEKIELRAQFAREIESARSQLTERESVLIDDHLKALEQLKKEHIHEMELLRKDNEERLRSLRAEYEGEKSSEMSRLSQRYDIDVADLSRSLSKRTDELKGLQTSHSSLLNAMNEKEKHLESVKNAYCQVKKDLKECDEKLSVAMSERDKLKNDILSIKTEGISKASELHEQYKGKMVTAEMKVKEEMEQYWMEKMKCEMKTLREELQAQNEEISRAALNKMIDIKDNSLKKAEENWLKEKEDLLQKIQLLQDSFKQLQDSSQMTLDNTQREAKDQLYKMKEELDRVSNSATTAVEGLNIKHSEELIRLRTELEEDNQIQTEELKELHRKELEELTKSNHLTCVALRDKMEREKRNELTALEQYHQQQQAQLETKYTNERQRIVTELQSSQRAELQREKERSTTAINEVKKEIDLHKVTISNLSEQSNSCKSLLIKEKEKGETLRNELNEFKILLEGKEKELIETKRDGQTILRLKEESLVSAHRTELDTVILQNKHQTQLLLNDFNKAKQLMNKKLQEKEKMLIEAEERYRSREPRPQDIELIQKLKQIITEHELKLKELTSLKKIYEMELMNREKNYNQIFNSSPLVGIMDPLSDTSTTSLTNNKRAVNKTTTAHSGNKSTPTSSLSSIDSLPSITRSTTKIRTPHKIKPEPIELDTSPRKLKFLSNTEIGGERREGKEDRSLSKHDHVITKRTWSERKFGSPFTHPSSTVHVAQ